MSSRSGRPPSLTLFPDGNELGVMGRQLEATSYNLSYNL